MYKGIIATIAEWIGFVIHNNAIAAVMPMTKA
jgi:hypothetical protein